MASEILISSDPWENRVAVLEDGVLAELYVEREEKVIGSIYKGKVQNVLPGMGAAFVDIGLGRNAFLYVDDINKAPLNIGDVEITHGHSGFTIGEKVKKGDDVLVQIVKEPRGLKGARISTNISLPGRYLILMPTGKYSGVSRKIESADERNKLKAVMKRIRPEGMATVVRTAAAGVSEAELIADLGVLIRMWHGILETFKRAPSPSLLHRDMNLVYKAARDFITSDVEKVLIDDEEEYRKVREFLMLLGPQYLDRVHHYNNGRDLFDDYKITEELQRLMKPKINLPSGGSIVIESTEALTVIDVNSGKFTGGKNLEDTIVKTNVEAASEIARQVRLRDIGGIIVVDFIDMSSESARSKVIRALEDGLRRDRTRATIQSFSNLGLLEFTRKRVGKDLGSQLRGSCPTCAGLGTVMSPQTVAIDTMRHVREGHREHGHIVAHVAPTVAAQMEFWYEDEVLELSKEIAAKIHVRIDPMLHPERFRINRVATFKDTSVLRVGDEHEVELLSGRLPNPTSAAAVVDGHLIEVENGANNAGNSAKIRVLDVDEEEDYVLAEMVTAGAAVGAAKKKRRRGGRGKELTAAEQTAQLRELAAEAASVQVARAPLGITSLTEEEEASDKAIAAETKGEHQPDAIIIGEVERTEGEAGHGKRKRRRRRRGGRGRGGDRLDAATQVGIPPHSVAAQGAPIEDEDDEDLEDDVQPAAQVPHGNGVVAGDGQGRKRRRRRRGGRGRSGEGNGPMQQPQQPQQPGGPPNRRFEPLTGSLPVSPSVPDRHVFRVDPDGQAQPTGRTAPREPSRAIAPLRRGSPAVDAPPPHLTLPHEEPRPTKPARRRRSTTTAVVGELETTHMRALPPPEAEKPKRTPRKKADAVAGAAPAKPKRAPAKKKADAAPSGVKKTSTAKKTSTTRVARKKKTTDE
ncbi:MAG TPA: Rne/Rng family ribonuclease [Candidatus Baltobacteraceae bacterium]|nr:Rne/Rng family ribonuclease [Candidatus Baltobacteraceae bacterium]